MGFIFRVLLCLCLAYGLATYLDIKEAEKMKVDRECVKEMMSHDWCSPIGGAMRACHTMIKKRCTTKEK